MLTKCLDRDRENLELFLGPRHKVFADSWIRWPPWSFTM